MSRAVSILLLCILLTTACSLLEALQTSDASPTTQLTTDIISPSPTAFQPIIHTPTPRPLPVWISPAVPASIRERIEVFAQSELTPILITDETQAEVRIEPEAESYAATWVYALVAPFPTLQDGMGLDDLQTAWSGAGGFQEKIYVSHATHEVLSLVFGVPAQENVEAVSHSDLVETAWADQPSYAILPFELIEPRWKVLALDGASPIERHFNLESYPLSMDFGLRGQPEAIEQFLRIVDWPTTNRDAGRMTILAMTGVTALTRSTAAKMEEHGVSYPGLMIGDWLREADLTHVSNEVAFDESCPTPDPYTAEMRFCSAPGYLELLDEVGVDLVELTGNHVVDWGDEALLYTLDLYHARHWLTFGGGRNLAEALRAVTIEHNGNRIALLGCNKSGPVHAWATEDTPGAAPCENEPLLAEAARMRAEGYIVVFTFQWYEGSALLPSQKSAFRAMIDAGATIVSGSQAHQPMGFEFYNGGFIHYGLGNLFFDQMQSLALRQEFIDFHVFYDGRYINTELRTALLEDYAQPRPMTPEERAAFLTAIFAKSGW